MLKSPAGEGRGSLQLTLSPAQIHSLLAPRGGKVRGGAARAEEGLGFPAPDLELGKASVQQVGDQLFRSLFSGQIKSLYDQSLGVMSSRAGQGLRIKLKFDAQDRELGHLISVPWEILWREETRDFLSLSRLSPVVRYLDVPRPTAPILLGSALRVLVVISSPVGLPALNVAQERANLEEACAGWKEVEVVEGADPAAIRRKLLEKSFHVLHFIGHGGFDAAAGEGVIFLEKPDGSPEPVTGQALATFLKDVKTLGLIFLNACDTARADDSGVNPFSGVAGALVLGGLPAVVAMQLPISDRAAIAFSTAFYQRLAGGDPVDASVVEGRQAILAAAPGTHEWATPVLFLRVPDGSVFRRPAQARRWPPWLVATLLVLLLVLMLPWIRGLSGGAARGRVLEIDKEFGSSVSGLSGVLETAELGDDGRMRLRFRFRNSSAQPVGLGFDYRASYLADGTGNEYKVLATDATAENAVDALAPGAEIERWMEFPAPLEKARRFHVALTGRSPASLRFPFFTIELPDYPPELSRLKPATRRGSNSLALPIRRTVATGIAGFQGGLQGIELRKDGRMRWSFDFWNRTAGDQPIGFDYSAIHLVDEHGNRYPVLGSDTGGLPGQLFQNRVPRALRRGYWFDFPAPRNGARSFTVVLAGPGKTVRFIPFDVRIPYYPPEYSTRKSAPVPSATPAKPTPAAPPSASPPPAAASAPSAVVGEAVREEAAPPEERPQPRRSRTTGKAAFETSIDGLKGSLVSVEGAGDGRLRWTVELFNESGRAVEVGFDAGESYLADNQGLRYGVLGTSRGGAKTLPPGGSLVQWFDFAAPAQGGRHFTVVLASHAPDELRYSTFSIVLPDLP